MKQRNEINRATSALSDVFGHLCIIFSKLDVSLSLFLFTTVHVGNEGQDSTIVQIWPSATLIEKNGNAIVLSFSPGKICDLSLSVLFWQILINNHYHWRSTVQVMSG